MIVDLERFVRAERAIWTELEAMLVRMEDDPYRQLELDQVCRFHYLFERTSADLARISTFSAEPETRRYLESLVARAYGEIHETRESRHRFSPGKWFLRTVPQTFRRHIRAFWLSLGITIAGCLFGGGAIAFDPESKETLMPFSHLMMDPAERVAMEEKAEKDRMSGSKASFSTHLMTHNTKVAINTMALGMTWGIGTVIVLFFNGIILGAVALDYILAGQVPFLLGWLMPHGVIEIPAILIGGQAGLILANALIGWGKRIPLAGRLRAVSADLLTLIGGVAIMLVWAGFVEAFLSQYHQPVIPYSAKIAFGAIELLLLIFWLSSGRTRTADA